MSDKEECPSFKYKDFKVGAEVRISDTKYYRTVHTIEAVDLHNCAAMIDGFSDPIHLSRLELVDKPEESMHVYNDDSLSWTEIETNILKEFVSDHCQTTEEHTGGSSSYYDVEVGGSTIRCLDLIEALDMSYNEGNIFKAVWRIAAAKQGKTKKGNNMLYDAEKVEFFGKRLVEEHKEAE